MKRLDDKYTIDTKTEETKPGCWNYLNVDVLCNGQKIGEYKRNYSNMYHTFCPFEWNGKEYALYSHDYQTTSLMSLPDCKLIAEHNSGFCPVDFAIPLDADNNNDSWFNPEELSESDILGKTAIVAGCCWGDDSGGWKIEAVDLSNINEDKLEVKPMFGYFESNYTGRLQDAVSWNSQKGFHRISLPMMMEFQFEEEDVSKSGFFGYDLEDIKHYEGRHWDNFKVFKVYDRDKKTNIKYKKD